MTIILGVLVVFPARSLAITLSALPTAQTVDLGTPVTVDIRISGLGGDTPPTPPSLGVYDLRISFAPTVLSVASVTFGDPVLGDQLALSGLSITSSSSGTGVVNIFELSLDSVDDLNNKQRSSFTLARFSFNAIGVGLSPIGFNVRLLGDANGLPLPSTIDGAFVTVTGAAVVPEPGALLLLGTGLAALGLVMRGGRLMERRLGCLRESP